MSSESEFEEDTLSHQDLTPPSGFSLFHLDPYIVKALDKMGFKEPSAIQIATLPVIQTGQDVISLAQTGSGKTAASAIPICNQVDTTRPDIQALIVVPTRELALQYATETQKIGKYRGVKAFAIFGGEDPSIQQSKLKHGVQVLIATPGRLIDFIHSRQIDLSQIKTLVLDEADEMLSMGFYDDLDFIMQCLVHPHQTLLFSATMPPKIRNLAKHHLQKPVEINLIKENASPALLEHCFVYCPPHHKEQELVHSIEKMAPKQAIIFCQSRFEVEKVCHVLKRKFSHVDFLHAGLTQDIRTIVTNKFRSGKIQLLVATDVVARGLDFSKVSHVWIYHLPDDPNVYVHRAGRTGRYGKAGMVISLVTQRELSYLKRILQHTQQEAKWLSDPPPAALQEKKSTPRRYYGRKPKA